MGINLSKGKAINLSKEAGLDNILVKLNWAPNKTNTGGAFDLDSSVFLCKLGADGTPQLLSDNHFVFYNNSQSPDGAVVHSGDDKTGADGEQLTVKLSALDPAVQEIAFVVTIHEGIERGQNFGQVPRSSITLVNADTGVEVAKYSLGDDFSSETALQFGSIYKRDDGDWAFKAIGTGYSMGLAEFVRGFGGNC
jgi:tellurium resistance protein TerD